MKKRLVFVTLIFIHIFFISFGQTKAIHYKSNQWIDTKNNGLDNPTNENVDIFKTDKSIKIVAGKQILNYKIVSSKPFSDHRIDYNVILNQKKYVIQFDINMLPEANGDFGHTILIEGVWAIPNVIKVSN